MLGGPTRTYCAPFCAPACGKGRAIGGCTEGRGRSGLDRQETLNTPVAVGLLGVVGVVGAKLGEGSADLVSGVGPAGHTSFRVQRLLRRRLRRRLALVEDEVEDVVEDVKAT